MQKGLPSLLRLRPDLVFGGILIRANGYRSKVAAMDDRSRRAEQREARDQHLKDVEDSLDRASSLIEDSKLEVQRSRDLLDSRRNQNTIDDREEDRREGPFRG